MRFSTKFIYLLLLAGSTALLSACKKDPLPVDNQQVTYAFSGQVVRSWNQEFLKIERNADGYRPAPATRAMAYLSLSAYEACIKGMPKYKSMTALCPGLQIPPLKEGAVMHWPTVVNASWAALMQHFFPNDVAEIQALETANNNDYQPQISADEFTLAQKYGRSVAAAVWEWSKTDAVGHDAYLDPFANYSWSDHFTQLGNWTPTSPGPANPLFPHWGTVRSFVLQPADKLCSPPGPDSLYAVQGMEIINMTAQATYDQQWIASFWNDDFLHLSCSTGPRWVAIANQVYAQEEVNLETAVYCNIKLGFALNDATVACWYSKYHYNRESPVSFIRRELDSTWQVPLSNPLTGEAGITPAYPSYPSDYATLAAAAAEVLTNVFGDHYAMTDRSHENEGTPRSFSSFQQMAGENAESRILNGVNFRMDTEQGLSFGQRCGQKVNALQWTN